jgi:hypothetical protein
MDTMAKLDKVLQHKQCSLISFEDTVYNKYGDTRDKLDANIDSHAYKYQDLLDIISVATTTFDNTSEFNLFYDSKIQKMKMFNNEVWKEFFLSTGIQELLKIIQENVLDCYECYLIRNNENPTTHFTKRAECYKCLEEYYQFLGCFDITPYVSKDNDDNKIIYTSDDERYWKTGGFELKDRYVGMYQRIKNKLTRKEMDLKKKDIKILLKDSQKNNIEELNKEVLKLICSDDDFRNSIVPTLTN